MCLQLDSRNYQKSLSKKMRSVAFASALAAKALEESIVVFEGFDLVGEKKTAKLSTILSKAGLQGKVLIVQGTIDSDLVLSARNLSGIKVTHLGEVNLYSLLNADVVVFTNEALTKIADRYSKSDKSLELKTVSKPKTKVATAKKTKKTEASTKKKNTKS